MSAPEPRPGEGWTFLTTPHGRFEYQFQGRTPTVRKGQYEDAADYQFLVLDANGWVYRIAVRIATEVESSLLQALISNTQSTSELIRVAAAQLSAGLQEFRPRPNAPFDELDKVFSLDLERATNLRECFNNSTS